MRQVPGTSDVFVNFDPGPAQRGDPRPRPDPPPRSHGAGRGAPDPPRAARRGGGHGAPGPPRRRHPGDARGVLPPLAQQPRRPPRPRDPRSGPPRGRGRGGGATSPAAILHESRQRQVSVNSQVEGRPLGDVMGDLRGRLAAFEAQMDDGYSLLYGAAPTSRRAPRPTPGAESPYPPCGTSSELWPRVRRGREDRPPRIRARGRVSRWGCPRSIVPAPAGRPPHVPLTNRTR